MYSHAGLFKEITDKTEKEIIIATDGLSKTISPLISRTDLIDGFYTQNGLALSASLN